MSVTALPPWKMDQPPPVPIRRFTVAEYQRLGETGILNENDRVELLEGWIVPKMVHNPPHDGTIQLVAAKLRQIIPTGWCDRIQSSITTDDSEPEPDIAVVRGDERAFLTRHPRPDEVGLIVEVAESSLPIDRRTKARLYARAGIPVYWIVNVRDGELEVYTDPSGPGDEPKYRDRQTLRAGDVVPFTLPDVKAAEIAVEELLP